MRQLILILAVAGLALAAACTPTRTTKSAGEQIDDSLITARVKAALADHLGGGESLRTEVETFRGRVQLNGFVDEASKREDAARVAQAVRGVTAVDNNLRVVTDARSAGDFVDDNVLTAKIKLALAGDATVAAHQVNVDVRRRVVQLAGFVDTAAQKTRAAELAGAIGGVEGVDNQLQVKRR